MCCGNQKGQLHIKHSTTIWRKEKFVPLYSVLVWAQLDYCLQFWTSKYKDVKIIESENKSYEDGEGSIEQDEVWLSMVKMV